MSVADVIIIGAGPGGLSLARLLSERGRRHSIVLEAAETIGGKSSTARAGDTLAELGTCYATRAHRVTNRWMREFRIETGRLGETRFGGGEFMDYVKAGHGPSLTAQLLTYFRGRARINKALAATSPKQAALDEAATDVAMWLGERKLGKVERFMRRSLTALGYGFLDETSMAQAVRWVDFDLILSGALGQLTMPKCGWSQFWEQVAEGLDVRTGVRVERIERSDTKSIVHLSDGQALETRHLVCAMPLDDFLRLTDATEREQRIDGGVDWDRYFTTLFAARDWFQTHDVEGWHEPLEPGAARGQLLSARLEGEEDALGGHLYVGGQLPGDYTRPELAEILRADVAKYGGQVTNIVQQAEWKFFPRYKPNAIRNGLVQDMHAVQGEKQTWFTGSTFSFEAVSNITNFNVGLASQIDKALGSIE